jgi:hypothetical protein
MVLIGLMGWFVNLKKVSNPLISIVLNFQLLHFFFQICVHGNINITPQPYMPLTIDQLFIKNITAVNHIISISLQEESGLQKWDHIAQIHEIYPGLTFPHFYSQNIPLNEKI